MDKKLVIYTGGALRVLIDGNIYTRLDVSIDLVKKVQECTEFNEFIQLMTDGVVPVEEVKKVDKSEIVKFIQQESDKLKAMGRDVSKYVMYEDKDTGAYKLANAILTRTAAWLAKEHTVIGNLQDLYKEKLENTLKDRIVNI